MSKFNLVPISTDAHTGTQSTWSYSTLTSGYNQIQWIRRINQANAWIVIYQESICPIGILKNTSPAAQHIVWCLVVRDCVCLRANIFHQCNALGHAFRNRFKTFSWLSLCSGVKFFLIWNRIDFVAWFDPQQPLEQWVLRPSSRFLARVFLKLATKSNRFF